MPQKGRMAKSVVLDLLSIAVQLSDSPHTGGGRTEVR